MLISSCLHETRVCDTDGCASGAENSSLHVMSLAVPWHQEPAPVTRAFSHLSRSYEFLGQDKTSMLITYTRLKMADCQSSWPDVIIPEMFQKVPYVQTPPRVLHAYVIDFCWGGGREDFENGEQFSILLGGSMGMPPRCFIWKSGCPEIDSGGLGS